MSSFLNQSESLSPRTSILKMDKIQLTSNKFVESKNDCCVTPTVIIDQDFHGNYSTPKKKHTVYFNMNANKTYIVESWKKYNLDPNNNSRKGKIDKNHEDDICTVF